MKLKNIVPKIQLKIIKHDGNNQTITTTKKRRIYANLRHDNGSEYKLKVVYGPGVENSGTFKTTSEAREALSAWTEKSLLDFISEGEWDD